MDIKSRILVVDDDLDILEIIIWILESEGFQVTGLDSGKDVMLTVNEMHPDVVVMDVQLGDSDGRDICRALKDGKATENIPVIMISANHQGKEMYQNNCRADDFLAKPFDIDELIDHVKRFAA